MKIDCVVVGELRENCYLIEKNHECLLIDPGDDYYKILKFIENKNVIGVLITHSHYDHIASLEKLVHKGNYPVYDYYSLEEGVKMIGGFCLEVIFTPGHKEDCVCYYFRDDKVMFVGDFLFQGSIGRVDLDGGNMVDMKKSIQKIKKYDDDIVIYPGHGNLSVLGIEKRYNPYFR